jgi:hypothetical protein
VQLFALRQVLTILLPLLPGEALHKRESKSLASQEFEQQWTGRFETSSKKMFTIAQLFAVEVIE